MEASMVAASVKPKADTRIACIDWMRGFVMILMILDHTSMAFNGGHFSADSVALFKPGAQLGAVEFLTRWITHLCAPTFVFLAGTALALSIQHKKTMGINAGKIDRSILARGLFIALLDPTLVSLFSWRLTFQVLYVIGASMMCMAFLRRLSSKILMTLALGWLIFGELLVRCVWEPAIGNPSIATALSMAFYYEPFIRVSYPLLPWLAIMCLGWVFGRYLHTSESHDCRLPQPALLLTLSGVISLVVFAGVRWFNGYGNMFLLREDNSWIQFLFVSKYPPSLSFMSLELGLLCLILAGMMQLQKRIGIRPNGVLLVFGQTALFFYLLQRIILEGLAQWGGLRGAGGLTTTYAVAFIFLVILYPVCRWYRNYKRRHHGGWTSFM
jgi:uncharacterized membrane protein